MLCAAIAVLAMGFAACSKLGIGPGNEGNGEEGQSGFNSAGASYALYSVAPGKQVHFSKGNLQYHPAFGAWRFADNQYDAMLDSNTCIAEDYKGWIDLFGWGTSGWDGGAVAYQPWSTDVVDTHYFVGGDETNGLFGPGAEGDWGVHNSIFGAGNQPGLWRTLKRDEWLYLVDSNDVRKNKCGFAKIADKHYGFVILPDDWKLPQGLSFKPTDGTVANSEYNSYSYNEWSRMDSAGAVFLPVGSQRGGKQIDVYSNDPYRRGFYWSASYRNRNEAYSLAFNQLGVNTAIDDRTVRSYSAGRHMGMSVRLVQDKK